MKKFVLVYDPDTDVSIEDRFLPLFGERPVEVRAFADDWAEGLDAETTVVTWLGDAELAEVIRVVMEPQSATGGSSSRTPQGAVLGLLPHPRMKQAQLGFGTASRLEQALEDILQAEEPIEVDLLWCNGRIVVNSVIVGDPFSVTPGTAAAESVWDRLTRFVRLARRLRGVVLRSLKLTTQKEKSIETAVIGVVVVQHGRSSTMTRRALSDSAVNDGMLNALVLAPRSIVQVLSFVFVSLFLHRGGPGRLPPFAGHIKTETLRITSQQPIGYLLDGESHSDKELEFRVEHSALRMFKGRNLSVDAKPPEPKENFRVQGLPVGEVCTQLVRSSLPWIYHASTDEFKELFQLLRQNARSTDDYLILMVLSTLLATFGLFANSAPVIIGAMILAPLMSPMISLSMGLLRQEGDLIYESGKTLLRGIGLALLGSVLLTLITPLQTINSEISARLTPTLLDLGVAVVSGMAGAFAHARSEVARSLAGVAIAVALVPPLAVSGIGIGWFNPSVFFGAFLLFLTNLAGILLAAAFTFLLMGYSAFGRAKRGLVTSLILVAVISIPLAFSFRRMVDEHWIIRQLDGWQVEGVQIRDVRISSLNPVYLSVQLVSEKPIDMARVDRVKAGVEERIGRDVQLEAKTAIVR